MTPDELAAVVEALIFAADEPLSVRRIVAVVDDASVDGAAVTAAVEQVRRSLEGRPYDILEVAGGYRMYTRTPYAEWVRRYKANRAEGRLSRAGLETLAIVAYKQPVVRAEVDSIRGVQSGPALRTLMEKGLVRIVGRSEEIGRPVQYGTTPRFLEMFGLRSIRDLPRAEEI